MHLHLPGLKDKVEYAQLLHDGSELSLTKHHWSTHFAAKEADDDTLTLELPVQEPDTPVTVIELFLK